MVIVAYPAYDPSVSTIAERIASLCKPDGEWSRHGLSREAGLSVSYVGQIIRGDVGEGVGLDVYIAIADAAKVSRAWLLLGEGPMERGTARASTWQAERARSVALLRGFISDRALALLESDPGPGEATLEYWFEVARLCRERARMDEERATPVEGARKLRAVQPDAPDELVVETVREVLESAPPSAPKRAKR